RVARRAGDDRDDPHLPAGPRGAPTVEGRLRVRRHPGGPARRSPGTAGGGGRREAAPLIPAAGLVVVPHLGGKGRALVLQARRVRPQGDRTPGPALGRADGARAGTLGALGLQGVAGGGAARGARSPRRGRATRDRGGGTAGQGR